MTFSRHAVQHQQGQVVGRVGRKRRASPSSPAALRDQAGLGALLVAGQRRTADVSSSRTGARAVSAAGHRDQTGPRGRGPGGSVLAVGAAGGGGGFKV